MTTEPHAVIGIDAPNTVAKKTSSELVNELAATSLAILDKRDEKTEFNKRVSQEIKKLEKRQRQLASEVKNGGAQLQMHFGSVVTDNEPEKPSRKGRRSSKNPLVS